MSFRNFRIYALSALIVCVSVLQAGAKEGGQEGHGGGSLMKQGERDMYGRQKIHLLDLWESVNKYGLHLRTDGSVDQQVARAFSFLKAVHAPFGILAEDNLKAVKAKRTPVDKEHGIAPPSDTGLEFLKRGYLLLGLARFHDDTGVLDIDEEIYSGMEPTHQAALWVHEAVYKTLRDLDMAVNSVMARKIVAYLFSEELSSYAEKRNGMPDDVKVVLDPIEAHSCFNYRRGKRLDAAVQVVTIVPHAMYSQVIQERDGKKTGLAASAGRRFEARSGFYQSDYEQYGDYSIAFRFYLSKWKQIDGMWARRLGTSVRYKDGHDWLPSGRGGVNLCLPLTAADLN